MSTASPSKEITASDAAYLVQCLQHGSSSVVLNVPAIAAAMNTKPHNVTCRISSFRKKYGLSIACTSAGSAPAATAAAATGKPGKTGKRGTAANAGAGVLTGRVGKARTGTGTGAGRAGNGKGSKGKMKAVREKDILEHLMDGDDGDEDEDEDGEENGAESEADTDGEAGNLEVNLGKKTKTKAKAKAKDVDVDMDVEMDSDGTVDGVGESIVKDEQD